MVAVFDISDPSEELDLDGLLMDIEEFDRHLEHTAEEEVISTFLNGVSCGVRDPLATTTPGATRKAGPYRGSFCFAGMHRYSLPTQNSSNSRYFRR